MHTWLIDGAKPRAQVVPFTMDNLEKHDNVKDVDVDVDVDVEQHEKNDDDDTLADENNGEVEDCCSIDSMSPMER